MIRTLFRLLKARGVWLRIRKKHKITDDTFVFLMMSKNTLENRLTLANLDSYIKRNRVKHIAVLTDDKENEVIKKVSDYGQVSNIAKEEMDTLLWFYRAWQFYKNFIVVSLNEPEGATGEEYLGKFGIDKNILVRSCILQMPPEE